MADERLTPESHQESSRGDKESALKSRNRLNQQRSRARRREYQQDLEVRFKACEKTGVTATVAVQNAAKKVLEENKKLWDLLRSLGVRDDDILRHVNSADGVPSRRELELAMEARDCGGPSEATSSDGERSQLKIVANEEESDSQYGLKNNTPVLDQVQPFPSAPLDLDALAFPSTACTSATALLIDMQCNLPAYELRAALGCSDNDNCTVDNETLLAVMDRCS